MIAFSPRARRTLLGLVLAALPIAAAPATVPSAPVALAPISESASYVLSADAPLGLQAPLALQSAALRGSTNDFKFIASRKGKPARWNPCAAVRYRINAGGMSSTDVREVRAAFNRVAAASGLKFTFAGYTSYVWSKHSRNGKAPNDAAFTFAFATSGTKKGQSDYLGGARVVGIGGPAWRDNGSALRIVAGHVVINKSVIVDLPRGTGKGVRMNAYLHEIGHAVGLDHVNGRSQLMHPTLQLNLPPVFGAGDVAGLRRVGRPAGCLTRP